MYIRQLDARHFRGFSDIPLKPSGNVVLMGEPGAGRSDLISAISKILDPDIIRAGGTTELDFHQRATETPIEISIVIGGLGQDLEQHFLDYLEVWNIKDGELVEESEAPEDATGKNYEWVLRLAYQGKWLPDQERCEEIVYYPKYSDLTSQSFRRTSIADIERLGFTLLRYDSGRILDLGSRGTFRKIVERSPGDDFPTALAGYVEKIADAAAQFTASEQVKTALGEVIASMREILRIQATTDASQLIAFSPEGGAPSGLLRSLGPTIDLGGGAGALPAWRQGSTVGTLFRLAESIALSSGSKAIVAIDDLGDGMDPASATHFAAIIRGIAGQAWIATRLSSIAEIFEPNEVIRLNRALNGTRSAHQGNTPTTKSEAIAARHWRRNLLPTFAYHSVIVVEGPHDLAALHALAIRLCTEGGICLPAAHSTTIISAGATGGGGYSSVLRITAAAREMGLCAIGIVDGDTAPEAVSYVTDHAGDANAIIRLPNTRAIEYAIVHSVPEDSMRQALNDVSGAMKLPAIPNLTALTGKTLESQAIKYIKDNTLHAAFVDALPFNAIAPLAKAILEKTMLAAREQLTGVIQL
jgi:putative ATP-dependent endonuclease of the OLD family